MAVCVLVSAGLARAEPDAPVLVVEEHVAANQGLVSALRIQLAPSAVRETVWSPSASSTAERIRGASALGRQTGAIATVWTESPIRLDDGSIETLLYLVSRRGERALLEVVRVPGDRGPDLDRMLALKVSELVAALRRHEPLDLLAEPSPPSAASAVPPSAASAAPPSAAEAPSERSAFGAFGQAGPRFLDALGWVRWGLGAELGPSWRNRRWLVALSLGLDGYPFASKSNDRGRVEVAEIVPRLLARVRWDSWGVSASVHAGIGLGLFAADGVSSLGARGSAHTRTLSGLAGIEIEREIARHIGVAALLEGQLDAHRQRFEIDATTVADLGRFSLGAGLMLVVHVP